MSLKVDFDVLCPCHMCGWSCCGQGNGLVGGLAQSADRLLTSLRLMTMRVRQKQFESPGRQSTTVQRRLMRESAFVVPLSPLQAARRGMQCRWV